MNRPVKLLYLGTFGVWRKALYGGQLRSERLARSLAKVTDLTYACSGHLTSSDHVNGWASTHSISNVIVSEPPTFIGASRWGNAWNTLRGLVPSTVPSDIVDSISDDLVARIRKMIGEFDLVWAYHSWHAEAALRAGYRRIICDVDDFEHVLARQTYEREYPFRRAPLHRIMNARLERYEYQIGSRFSEIVVSKEEDLALLSPAFKERYTVVPNGFDFPAVSGEAEGASTRILFVGHLGYGPNIDAILWLLRDILPRICGEIPAASLTIAGRGPANTEVKRLVAISRAELIESPESLDELYSQATVVVAPIRLGHGTRIKVLEAAAHRRAMVATTEAVRGHPLLHGEDLLLADDTDSFADACITLLTDGEKRARLAANARQTVEQLGGWERSGRIARQVVDRALHA